ncbi:hypothetical protein OESDEN_09220 [Oesophagostomum dentatum]|uniref:Uncharacterized protein n=1 Tax=Oesophagostomum dentatum TaxID=61180 RepID=A0A0B1T051_OESDE|nr:hypothetical protein OESDEN_09220 [Oesophagostomum dentatum]
MPEENEQIGPSLIAMGYGWDPYAYNVLEPGLQIAEYRDFRQISNEIIGFESSSSSCERGKWFSILMCANISNGYAMRQVYVRWTTSEKMSKRVSDCKKSLAVNKHFA